MEHKEVTSSNIKSVGHCPQTNTLEVIFNNGTHYAYEDVSVEKYNELMKAQSIGSHIHHHIKSKHNCKKIK